MVMNRTNRVSRLRRQITGNQKEQTGKKPELSLLEPPLTSQRAPNRKFYQDSTLFNSKETNKVGSI
jgi:hypothetical protein